MKAWFVRGAREHRPRHEDGVERGGDGRPEQQPGPAERRAEVADLAGVGQIAGERRGGRQGPDRADERGHAQARTAQ